MRRDPPRGDAPWRRPVAYRGHILEPSNEPLGPLDQAPGGAQGAVLQRWFDAVARGEEQPCGEAVVRCLTELRDVTEHYP